MKPVRFVAEPSNVWTGKGLRWETAYHWQFDVLGRRRCRCWLNMRWTCLSHFLAWLSNNRWWRHFHLFYLVARGRWCCLTSSIFTRLCDARELNLWSLVELDTIIASWALQVGCCLCHTWCHHSSCHILVVGCHLPVTYSSLIFQCYQRCSWGICNMSTDAFLLLLCFVLYFVATNIKNWINDRRSCTFIN